MYGVIDIDIHEGPNGRYYATGTAHRSPPPGDDDPVQWGGPVEYDDLGQAIRETEDLARQIVRSGETEQASVFVDGNEHLTVCRPETPPWIGFDSEKQWTRYKRWLGIDRSRD